MTDLPEYVRRAEDAERRAVGAPPGFHREELLRNAAAYRRTAQLLEEERAKLALRPQG